MWGLISGVEKTSPRTELPLVIDHPTSHNAALIVGDYKLLLGTIGLAYLFSATQLSNAPFAHRASRNVTVCTLQVKLYGAGTGRETHFQTGLTVRPAHPTTSATRLIKAPFSQRTVAILFR